MNTLISPIILIPPFQIHPHSYTALREDPIISKKKSGWSPHLENRIIESPPHPFLSSYSHPRPRFFSSPLSAPNVFTQKIAFIWRRLFCSDIYTYVWQKNRQRRGIYLTLYTTIVHFLDSCRQRRDKNFNN